MANHSGRISSDLHHNIAHVDQIVQYRGENGLLGDCSFILLGVEDLNMGGVLDLWTQEEQCGSMPELRGYPRFFLEGPATSIKLDSASKYK